MSYNWIDELPATARAVMLENAVERAFAGNLLLHQQDARQNCFYQIITGTLRQYMLAADGSEVLIYKYEAGDVVGDVAVLDREPFPLNVATAGRALLRCWSVDGVHQMLGDHPAIRDALVRQLAKRMRAALLRLQEVCLLPAATRIASHLLSLAKAKQTYELRLSQTDLGCAIGLSRQCVNGALTLLCKEHLINRSYGRLIIVNPPALASFAMANHYKR